MTGSPELSIIVPARNAAATLAETLDCLLEQTSDAWEAIVIDDDSTDDTRAIATRYAGRNDRIRVIGSSAHSEGGARNAGLDVARGTFVLFLDADDRIEPATVASVLGALERGPSADGVVFGWIRSAPDGSVIAFEHWSDDTERFRRVASYTPFPIHACVVRRSLVDALGRFDTTLDAAADWDLWIRVFRAGARLVRIGDVLAYYRLRTTSMSKDARAMLEASMRVLDRAYAPDPRVGVDDPRYASPSAAQRRAAVVRHVCWWASTAIETGRDPMPLIDAVSHELASPAYLDVGEVADVAAFGLRQLIVDQAAWQRLGEAVRAFLERVEIATTADGFAWRTLLLVASANVEIDVPARRSGVQAVVVELSKAVEPIVVGPDVRRVLVVGRLEGRPLGSLELAPVDGAISGDVLHDAVAAQWSWQLAGAHVRARGRVSRAADSDALWAAMVDEMWLAERPVAVRNIIGGLRPIEVAVGRPLPRIFGVLRSVSVRVRVGSTLLAPVRIPAADARRRRRLAVALTVAHRTALFEAVAREALVGRVPGRDTIARILADGAPRALHRSS